MNYELILETYTMKEILEYNDITEEDVLRYIVENGFIDLPPEPVDINGP